MDNIVIDVRNTRAYVARKVGTDSDFTYEPCANWTWLEDAAAAAVEAQGGSITLSGQYPCPDDLARFALWREDVLNMVTTPSEAALRFGKHRTTVQKALEDKRIAARRSGTAQLLLWQDAEAEWG